MLKWFWENKGSLLLSFVLAVTVWVAAVVAKDPILEQVMEQAVPIQYSSPNEGLQMVGNPPSEVIVTIKAPESVWQEISLETITIEVDLVGLEAGIHKLDLTPFYDLQPLQIVAVEPDSTLIKLESLLSKELPVTVRVIGDPALTYEADDPVATPNKATIVGPTSSVTNIVEIRAEISVAGASQNIEEEINLIAIDENDGQVEGVEISPSIATVLVPIEQGRQYRLVSVIADIDGSPAYGYRVIGIDVLPDEILVTSSGPDAFDALTGFLKTEAIDLTGVTETVERDVSLVFPPMIFPVLDQSVRVIVTIKPIETSINLDIPVEVVGLGSGLAALPSPDTVAIFIEGPLAILEELLPSHIRVVLNLVDYEIGNYDVIPEVITPSTELSISILPEFIEVEIIVAPPATPTPVP
jgi:YbbR domain-containing protein